MSQLQQFVVLLAAHWFADFVCQTHWQAANKSKNNLALFRHVTGYSIVLAAASALLVDPDPKWLGFVLLNFALHFATDYFTSRWSSRLFALALRDTAKPWNFQADAARHWHNFFVVIGFDQLIHQVTLAATFWWLTSNG